MADVQYFQLVDYLVFGFLLLCSALIGVYFGFFAKQKQDNTKEYLMGGKTMGIFPISMSLISSSVSGISLLGLPSEIYVYGGQFYLIVLSEVITMICMVYVYLPVFYTLQITSSYEYLKLRFNQKVRMVGSVLFLIKMFLYIPVVIYVPALAFNQVTGINLHLITPVVCLVCIFYTTIGGLKAVVWTDTLQTVLMYGGVATVMVLGTIRAGGLQQVIDTNRATDRLEFFNLDLDPTLRSTFWTISVGELFGYLSSCAVNQAMVQRCLAMPNLLKANITVLILAIGKFLIVTMCCYTGLVIFTMYSRCDPVSTKMVSKADQLLPFFVMGISESVPGLPGLFVAGVFSAALSTMSTGLNSMTGVILEDMIRPWLTRPISEARAANIMKVVAALIGALCVALVFIVEKMGALLQVGISLSAITSGALLGVFTLGMFFPWANSKGAMAGTLTSVLLIAWISVGSQTAIATGQIVHSQKPVFTDQCPSEVNITGLHYHHQPEQAPVFLLYRISFMYYTMIGTLTVILVGLVVSFVTGANEPGDVNPDLLTPVIHRLLPKKKIREEQVLMFPQENVKDKETEANLIKT